MGALGISLLVASVVLLAFTHEQWLPSILGLWRQTPTPGPPPGRLIAEEKKVDRIKDDEKQEVEELVEEKMEGASNPVKSEATPEHDALRSMPPPPLPLPRIANPPAAPASPDTTPKATAATRNDAVPTFTLSDGDQTRASSPPRMSTPSVSSSAARPKPSLMMPPPPPRPPTLSSSSPLSSTIPRPPTLSPMVSSIHRLSPAPSRLGQPRQPGSSTLAPPPSHNSIPTKPSRAVVLTPGHSPLDWARLSSSPHVDLRNLPGGPSASYLRVTPSMLKRQTGRRGKDAWTAMGGKVYNITPYLPFHPGGEPELLRGAGRDSTKLFGEVHPWVNYENMLASCLVGIMVSEREGEEAQAQAETKMDEMD